MIDLLIILIEDILIFNLLENVLCLIIILLFIKSNYNTYGLIDRNILEVFFNIDDYEKKPVLLLLLKLSSLLEVISSVLLNLYLSLKEGLISNFMEDSWVSLILLMELLKK